LRGLFIIGLVCFFLQGGVCAQAAPGKELESLELLRHCFVDVADFTAEITQEKQLALLKRTMISRGMVRFKKPDLFFMEIYPPYASRLLLKNNVLDLYLVKEKISQHLVLPPEEGLQKWFTFLAKPVTSLPDGVDIRAEQRGTVHTLRITPRTKGQVKSFSVTFLEDGRLRKLVIEERNGDRTAIEFKKMRKNAGLSERHFLLE
jgi:outer membrane lipoprotein carrier protein